MSSGFPDSDDYEMDEDQNESPEKKILWAAANGEASLTYSLLIDNPSLVYVKDNDGYTPLHRACYENHLEIAKMLLKFEANIAALTNENWQPLHSASRWNSSLCVALLLDWGADVNSVTRGGLTPLHLAASNPNGYESLLILLSHPLVDINLCSSTGETAYQISRRCGPHSQLFEIRHKSLNTI